MVCPSCEGRGGGKAFVHGRKEVFPGVWRTFDTIRWTPCSTCKGTKKITEEHYARIEFAKIMRVDRVARRATIREEGARLGCDFGEWSRIECGDEPETEAGRAALEKRKAELNKIEEETNEHTSA